MNINVRNMTEEKKAQIAKTLHDTFDYTILPTGGRETVDIGKDDVYELVYYFKKPIEDILGDRLEEAEASGDMQKYYLGWVYDMEYNGKMYKKEGYGKYLKEAGEYVMKHGIWKDGWKD